MLNITIKRTLSLFNANIVLGALAYASNNFKGLTGSQSYGIACGISTLKPYIENLQHTQEDKMKELGVFKENNSIMSQSFKDARVKLAAKYGVELDEKGNPTGSLENMQDLNAAAPELQKLFSGDASIAAYTKIMSDLLQEEVEISILAMDAKILSDRNCPPSVAWGLSLLTAQWSENENQGKEYVQLSPNQAATLKSQFDKFNQTEIGLNSGTSLKVGVCIDVLSRGLSRFGKDNPTSPKTDEEITAFEVLANKPQSWHLPTFNIYEFANDEITGVDPGFFMAIESLVKDVDADSNNAPTVADATETKTLG